MHAHAYTRLLLLLLLTKRTVNTVVNIITIYIFIYKVSIIYNNNIIIIIYDLNECKKQLDWKFDNLFTNYRNKKDIISSIMREIPGPNPHEYGIVRFLFFFCVDFAYKT